MPTLSIHQSLPSKRWNHQVLQSIVCKPLGLAKARAVGCNPIQSLLSNTKERQRVDKEIKHDTVDLPGAPSTEMEQMRWRWKVEEGG